MPENSRRTKRRYAHELYQLAEEGETRPLAVEVPSLYASSPQPTSNPKEKNP